MEFRKKKILGSTILAASLSIVTFMTLLTTTSAPALIVMAKPMPGAYEIDIYGDASAVHQICEMFRHFSAMKFEWSTSIPTYPSGYIDFALDVRDLDFEKLNGWTYRLSLKGMEEASMLSGGVGFIVKARSGQLDLVFSDLDPYYGYYRTVDITGKLKGDVLFHIDAPPSIPAFHYEGSELTIHVHIGMY